MNAAVSENNTAKWNKEPGYEIRVRDRWHRNSTLLSGFAKALTKR
jgi:hypothetical protein